MTAAGRARLADQLFAVGLDEVAEHERDDDRVVELAGDGNEVGDEIERQREVADEPEQRACS